MPGPLLKRTIVSTTEIGTETDSPICTETGTVTITVTVTNRSETSETGIEREISGIDGPSSLVALTDEAMLHDLPLSFATTSLRMVTIMSPLHAVLMPTIGVELLVAPQSMTAPSHLHSTTRGLHSTTVVCRRRRRHHPLLLMTVVCPWMTAR